ncbi:MAG: hypothetical protein ACLUSP_00560 [Christensenellales bacterium]
MNSYLMRSAGKNTKQRETVFLEPRYHRHSVIAVLPSGVTAICLRSRGDLPIFVSILPRPA